MDCQQDTSHRAQKNNQEYAQFNESNYKIIYSNIDNFLESNLIKLEEIIIPNHNTPNWSIVRQLKYTGC